MGPKKNSIENILKNLGNLTSSNVLGTGGSEIPANLDNTFNKLKEQFGEILTQLTPTFKVALREDVKDESMFLPTKGEPHATGFDVRACPKDKKDILIKAGQYFMIPLGFRALCPAGWGYFLLPRSSTFGKKHLHYLIGVIDESWEGETVFAGQYIPDTNKLNDSKDIVIKFGDAIAQIIPHQKPIVSFEKTSNKDLDQAFDLRGFARKDGGFGSTDK